MGGFTSLKMYRSMNTNFLIMIFFVLPLVLLRSSRKFLLPFLWFHTFLLPHTTCKLSVHLPLIRCSHNLPSKHLKIHLYLHPTHKYLNLQLIHLPLHLLTRRTTHQIYMKTPKIPPLPHPHMHLLNLPIYIVWSPAPNLAILNLEFTQLYYSPLQNQNLSNLPCRIRNGLQPCKKNSIHCIKIIPGPWFLSPLTGNLLDANGFSV